MATSETAERVTSLLSEYRIVTTALAVLLGFQFQIGFAQGFREIPELQRFVSFGAILCTTTAIVFLLTPAGAHRRAARVIHDKHFLARAKRCGEVAFFFLAASLAASIWIQAERTFATPGPALLVAGLLVVLLGVLWWLLPYRWGEHARRHVGES